MVITTEYKGRCVRAYLWIYINYIQCTKQNQQHAYISARVKIGAFSLTVIKSLDDLYPINISKTQPTWTFNIFSHRAKAIDSFLMWDDQKDLNAYFLRQYIHVVSVLRTVCEFKLYLLLYINLKCQVRTFMSQVLVIFVLIWLNVNWRLTRYLVYTLLIKMYIMQ